MQQGIIDSGYQGRTPPCTMGNYIAVKDNHGMEALIDVMGRVIGDRKEAVRFSEHFKGGVIGKGLRFESCHYGLRLYENHGKQELLGILLI